MSWLWKAICRFEEAGRISLVSPCARGRRHTRKRYKVDGCLLLQRWKTAWLSRCLAPQTWSVQDCVRTDRRTLRLAIATWEKGASWRTQGWAGENGDRSDRAMHPSQVAGRNHPSCAGHKNQDALLLGTRSHLDAPRVGGFEGTHLAATKLGLDGGSVTHPTQFEI